MIARQRALRALALVTFTVLVDTTEFCNSITSCLKEGQSKCDTSSGKCPPCIYVLNSTLTCWEKDNTTNTCPFTGVRHDCSALWESALSSSTGVTASATPSSSSNSTNSTASPSSSSGHLADASSDIFGGLSTDVIIYGAIGVGAILILVIFVIVCVRRRKTRRHREYNKSVDGTVDGHQDGSDKHAFGLHKCDDSFPGPYNANLDTSRVNFAASSNDFNSRHTVGSRQGPIKSSSQVRKSRSQQSLNGVSADPSRLPGKGVCELHKSGGRSVRGGNGAFPNVNKYVQHDISSRCSSTPNVFGEYLRMKQEMQYDDAGQSTTSVVSIGDTISDLDSGKYSFESLQGTDQPPQGRVDLIGRSSIAESITDSEYGDQSRGRGESECDSEMSYNDEKYSFCSVGSFDNSQLRKGEREIEI